MPYLIFEVASIQIDDQIAEYVFILRRLMIFFLYGSGWFGLSTARFVKI